MTTFLNLELRSGQTFICALTRAFIQKEGGEGWWMVGLGFNLKITDA